jgi:O-antigen/teichoic acid export membrane protein
MPLVVLLFFGPDLFELVFGTEWRQAGVYAQWMAPWIYLQFQWSPLSMLSHVMELQREALIAQFMALVLRFSSLIIAWLLGVNADVGIAIFALVSAVAYILIMVWFMRKAGVSTGAILMFNAKYILASLVIVFPLWLVFRSV